MTGLAIGICAGFGVPLVQHCQDRLDGCCASIHTTLPQCLDRIEPLDVFISPFCRALQLVLCNFQILICIDDVSKLCIDEVSKLGSDPWGISLGTFFRLKLFHLAQSLASKLWSCVLRTKFTGAFFWLLSAVISL